MIGDMIVAWLVMEILTNVIFLVINPWIGPSSTTLKSFFKRILKHVFLTVGILAGYPHV